MMQCTMIHSVACTHAVWVWGGDVWRRSERRRSGWWRGGGPSVPGRTPSVRVRVGPAALPSSHQRGNSTTYGIRGCESRHLWLRAQSRGKCYVCGAVGWSAVGGSLQGGGNCTRFDQKACVWLPLLSAHGRTNRRPTPDFAGIVGPWLLSNAWTAQHSGSSVLDTSFSPFSLFLRALCLKCIGMVPSSRGLTEGGNYVLSCVVRCRRLVLNVTMLIMLIEPAACIACDELLRGAGGWTAHRRRGTTRCRVHCAAVLF
jgi:hypothetical protein